MSHNARQTGPALEAMYRFTLWLIPTLEKFPRSQRFLLGDRIETAALDVPDLLIQATDTRERVPLLRRANLGLERLRMFAQPPTPAGSGSAVARRCVQFRRRSGFRRASPAVG